MNQIHEQNETNSDDSDNEDEITSKDTTMTFDGDKEDVEVFIAQYRLYFLLNNKIEWTQEKQVLYVSSKLKGGPLKWITQHLREYLDNNITNSSETNKLFDKKTAFIEFVKQIRVIYAGGDIKREAQLKLSNLR